MFAALGLPSVWLHNIYQAVLAPVRVLWHYLPHDSYMRYYQMVDDAMDVKNHVPGICGFAFIISKVLWTLAADTAAAAATSSVCMLTTLTSGATMCLIYLASHGKQGECYG